ncbi:MAG: hypothetical protein RL563_2339 [Pseudomonadota bacterium]
MKIAPETVARQYVPGDMAIQVSPLGQGLINDTYRIASEVGNWVLQRLNPEVFPEPCKVMDNLLTLSEHVQHKAGEPVSLQIPLPIFTIEGQPYHLDAEGQCWRAIEYIEPSESRQILQNDAEAAQVGWALGHFHRLCSDLPTQSLHDTIPGFHITPHYFQSYQQCLQQSVRVDSDSVFDVCADFISRYQSRVVCLEIPRLQGKLSNRVIHGDPKLNNFLFRPNTDTIISLIDLDTVKPGLPHYDIGDCLRSCCRDPRDNCFDLRRAKIILRHYLQEAGAFFQSQDYDYLYSAIWLIPFELGIRFFSDYLKGDHYFKTTYPKENLNRAQAQFTLCDSIEVQKAELEQTISDLKSEFCRR